MRLHWLPQSQGDDYEIQQRFRTGKTFGDVPFDELFILGLERDNDLEMRGHIGTRDGRKGSAPLGRNYFLSNWEADKNVYSNGIFTVKLGPFLDTGKITDASTGLGSQKWLWDWAHRRSCEFSESEWLSRTEKTCVQETMRSTFRCVKGASSPSGREGSARSSTAPVGVKLRAADGSSA